MGVLTRAPSRVRVSKHVHIRCIWSPAPALDVPCTPMPVVTSVSERLVHHVFRQPRMTFGEPTISDDLLDQGRMASKELRDTVCPPSLGTSLPIVRTLKWSRPMEHYRANSCLAVLPYL